jgi:hypothetical protein
MIRTLGFQDTFYLVMCADIECMVLANSFEEAATNGLKNILKKLGSKTNLSFLISVDLINNHEIETSIFQTSSILNDLGYFKLAKDLESLRDFFLDKGENSH